MNRNKIYHDLGFSIRKVNKEWNRKSKTQLFDGYLRVFFRTLIIGIFSVIAFLDYQHKETPLSEILEGIKNDYIWAINPDIKIKPLYEEHIKIRSTPEFIKSFPDEKIEIYEEYRKPYIENHFLANTRILLWSNSNLFGIYTLFLPPPPLNST